MPLEVMILTNMLIHFCRIFYCKFFHHVSISLGTLFIIRCYVLFMWCSKHLLVASEKKSKYGWTEQKRNMNSSPWKAIKFCMWKIPPTISISNTFDNNTNIRFLPLRKRLFRTIKIQSLSVESQLTGRVHQLLAECATPFRLPLTPAPLFSINQ